MRLLCRLYHRSCAGGTSPASVHNRWIGHHEPPPTQAQLPFIRKVHDHAAVCPLRSFFIISLLCRRKEETPLLKSSASKGHNLVPRCMCERILRPRDHGAAVGQIDRHDFITSVNPVVETSLLVHDGVNSCLIFCPVMGNEIVA